MAETKLRQLAFGFIAAALSVVLFHQAVAYALSMAGMIAFKPWFDSVPPLGVPVIVNHMFWAGLWGALFAMIWRKVPGPSLLLKGINFALLGPLITGRWIVIPLLKNEPLFAGFKIPTMPSQVLIAIAFGAGLALIYGMLARPDEE